MLWLLSTEKSELGPWHAAQLSPNVVVFASAWEAADLVVWQARQAADVGPVVLV